MIVWPFYALAIIFGAVAWYFHFGLELWANGAEPDHWRHFWEEFRWAMPGGRGLRADYIRRIVDRDGADGYMGGWSYEEIRRGNLYEAAGRVMLPGFWHFLFTHITVPLGPVTLVHLVVAWFNR